MEPIMHPLILLPAITFAAFAGYVAYRWMRVRAKMKD